MSEAAGQFLLMPLAAWSDVATPLLGVPLGPYQPLATRLDPALVARLIETPPAPPAPATPAAAAAANPAASPAARPTAPSPALRSQAATGNTIGIDDFSRIELRVARVIAAERVEGSDKLLRLNLDLGAEPRQVLSGIRASYAPEQLVGRLLIVVANLEPRKMRFGVSAGMVLCASGQGDGVFLLSADSGAEPGMKVT
jgi:methionyl-tRNA synthetase